MRIIATPLAGVLVLEPRVFVDERGFFMESFNRRQFSAAGGPDVEFVQDNHSRSTFGVVRGLHYQREPYAQGKLVRVVRGAIFDVAVDLRRASATFGRWFGVELSETNHREIWIPPGFAHGFAVTTDVADVLYKTTDYYTPAAEVCIRWDDPKVGVAWPSFERPVISAKDGAGLALADAPTFP